ncbi:YtcA family lipoprotein [Variovorax sp. GT1P44]|uniref:YtcA family lipoprotein n=1 Tax=Variovorax sp. GT1P44 TaxID=3443742 RepID=UPI003F4622F7
MPSRIRKIKHAHTVTTVLVPLISFTLTGCAQRGAPSFALFGAYFPAWMLCAFIGILASIGARAVFVATGLSNALPFQLFVCVSIGVCVALLVWSFRFA